MRTPPDPRRARVFAGLIAAALCMSGCSQDGGTAFTAPAGTPIVLISIDTLRSDHLPVYGYTEVETPALDRLRRDSILYERAYSHIPLTLPAHASILTGLLPPEHKVRDNLGYRLDTDAVPFLPRLLKARGYQTGAAVSAFVLQRATGLDDGFDFYDDAVQVVSGRSLGVLQRRGEETLAVALEWLQRVEEGPFFLFFHIYEPHSPYDPPEPMASRYPDSPYDGEIAQADLVVGRLLERLRELDLYDSALIVLLSDHGEALGEHGQPEHEVLVYRETIQVPLLLKLPGGERRGTSVGRPVQLIDILPTLDDLGLIDLPAPLRGRSLLAGEATEPVRIYAESYYARLHFGWSEQRSIVTERYQLIVGPAEELYDLQSDTAQLNSLTRQNRRLAAELAAEALRISGDFEAPSEIDAETMSKLAALGYLGATLELDPGETLPDPKDKADVLLAVARGLDLMARGDYADAAAAFELVVGREPKVVDAWSHLGKARHRTGRLDDALQAYEEALRLSSGAPHIALLAADLYLDRGDLAKARQHAELAATRHPAGLDLLAQIALREGDLDRAQRHVDEAVAIRGTRVGPLVTQAQLSLELGAFDEALALTHKAESEFGERHDREVLRGLYFVRGSVLARQGKSAEAIEAFRAEIALTPSALAPYSHLAVVYALIGQTTAVGATLKAMVETNPTATAHAEAVRVLRQLGDARSAGALLAQALKQWPADPELGELARQPA